MSARNNIAITGFANLFACECRNEISGLRRYLPLCADSQFVFAAVNAMSERGEACRGPNRKGKRKANERLRFFEFTVSGSGSG
jgi:hypothetical protein